MNGEDRYLAAPAHAVRRAGLPMGVSPRATGGWVIDTLGVSAPVWYPHIMDARENADAWNHRYAAGLTA